MSAHKKKENRGRLDETAPIKLDGIRVLLVVDDKNTREAIRLCLKSFGATIALATSSADGLKKILSLKPTVLVSDIAMAEEDGYEFLRKIPALALTANASPSDVDAALKAGFQAHLAKPVETTQLGRAILHLAKSKLV